jgi:hypothetical protein
VNGTPLLNTYREWLEGPYMRRGIQCQHCHMAGREHTFRGVHDPQTFRQAISVSAISRRTAGEVHARARVTNVGAGHMVPTTPTPAAWLIIELVDRAGRAVDGARTEQRIGRHIESRKGNWFELEDTRIAPGASLELAGAWTSGRVDEATGVRVTVRVHPDDFYEGFYRQKLSRRLDPEARALFEEALATALAARYVAFEETFPIPEAR